MSSTTPQGPDGPECLESSAGDVVASDPSSADNRKRLIALGGVVGVLAVGGAAAWAATSFLGTGAQPAEALPAKTLGYAAIDLDPSGGQKIEAIKTLRKFPAFKEEIGLETDDDLRERLFEEITSSGECEGLDYAADVEPWLGDRAAVAAVDLGADEPAPVMVVQVKDSGAAEEGLATLRETCGGDESAADAGGWVVVGDWAVVAEDEATAQQVSDAAEEGNLADDEIFQKWGEEAGDAGIMTMYAAPELGPFLARMIASEDLSGLGADAPSAAEVDEALQDFQGAAATLRFSGGSLELEFAGDAGATSETLMGSSDGGDAVASLPDDTVAAFGLSFDQGWFTKMVEQVAASAGQTPEEFLAEMSQVSGLDLPADAETLVGDAVAVSMGAGFDLESFVNGGPAELPVGITIEGDPAEIEAVLEKIRPQLGDDADLLVTETTDDTVTISPNAEYRAALAQGGDLGGTKAFASVIEDADDASALVFVNFDADDNWLARLAGDDPQIAENLEPLAAFGLSAWRDDDVSHSLLRLTTD